MNQDCLFCKIVSGKIPSKLVYDDDDCVAFDDINPQAPTHMLIIPRHHISSLANAKESDKDILGHLLFTAGKIAHQKGFSKRGYRVVLNTNEDGGQTVFHLHVHLLAGRRFVFPPG